MLLRLPYLALTSVFAFILLLPMSNTDKDIEILTLRHELVVLQRQTDRSRLTPPDRAYLAALLHRLPQLQLRQLDLIVSPDRPTVSTVRKSQASIPAAWARRNCVQVGPRRGAGPRR